MLPFHIPHVVWLIAVGMYAIAILTAFWVRFAKEPANQQVAQICAVTWLLVLTVHLVHEIMIGSGFWLAGAIVYVIVAVACVMETGSSKPTREF